jgi:hypothetical protein
VNYLEALVKAGSDFLISTDDGHNGMNELNLQQLGGSTAVFGHLALNVGRLVFILIFYK